MWLVRFAEYDDVTFYVFAVVVVIIVVDSSVSMSLLRCFEEHSPGSSVSFFIFLSTILVSLTVLVRGLKVDWAAEETLRRICRVYVAMAVFGFTLFAVSLAVKLTAVNLAFNHLRINRKPFAEREWRATAVLWTAASTATAVVVLWEIFFTPDLHVHRLQTETLGPPWNLSAFRWTYECRGYSPDGDRYQVLWRVSVSVAVGIILVYASSLMVPLATVRLPTAYRTDVVVHCLMTTNALICAIAGIVVWLTFHSPGDSTGEAAGSAAIGALELWVALFSNAMLLVSMIDKAGNLQQSNRKEAMTSL